MNPKLIYIALAFLSVVLFVRLFSFYKSIEKYPSGTVITFETQLLSQPKLSSRGQQMSLSMPNSQRVTALFTLDPLLSYGDVVKIEGKIEYFEAKNADMVAFINYPRFQLIQKESETNLIYKVRENIINFFNSSLPPTYSALMLGIVFGIKEEMPPDFYLDLQKTGLMHVIAASGMNITMLGGFLSLFFALFLRRQLALIFTILGIILYALMAGLEPSIVRASIMGILVFSAQLTGRQSSAFLALFGAGFLMLFRNPELIFDIGFQLSFLATFGLIYLRPIFFISHRLKKVIEKSIIGEDLATTLTAQIFTLPILLVNFGTYSLWSILVNAIVLWTVPIIMVIGGISAIIGLITEPVGRVILYFSLPFLLYFTKIVGFFGNFGGQIEIKSLPLVFICGYYLIIISLILYVRGRK